MLAPSRNFSGVESIFRSVRFGTNPPVGYTSVWPPLFLLSLALLLSLFLVTLLGCGCDFNRRNAVNDGGGGGGGN